MTSESPSKYLESVKYDFPAGIVVFLVALPLCLGISLASGAPLFSGMIAGFIGGIVVALLSGSALGVSGPAAGLIVVVLHGIEDVGFAAFETAVLLSGVMQIALGFARAGFIAYYFPTAVIKGMLSAIGILIVIKQIPHAMGYDLYRGMGYYLNMDLSEYNLEGISFEGINLWEGYVSSFIVKVIQFFTPGAFIIWVVSMGILLLWEKPFFKSKPIFQWIQGSLVVVITGAIFGHLFDFIPSLALAKSHFVSAPVADSVAQFFGFFSLPDPGAFADKEVYTLAVTMALIGSLETLLCVEATDKLDPQRRFTPANRELKAQGVGNLVSGLIGGLPITQVIVRSSANIQAGGRTKLAAVIHGLLLLSAAVAIPRLLNMIPFASLAAILMMVGYKLAKPILFKEALEKGHYQFAPFIITIVAIVFSNLLVGVALGFATSAFFILLENFKAKLYYTEDVEAKKIVIRLGQHISFLNKANILNALNELPHNYHVVIDGSHCSHIDYDVFEIFENFAIETRSMGIKLELIGVTLDKARPFDRRNPDRVIQSGDFVERRGMRKEKDEG